MLVVVVVVVIVIGKSKTIKKKGIFYGRCRFSKNANAATALKHAQLNVNGSRLLLPSKPEH